MVVYVLDINGQPLMPTTRCGHVRKLLKSGKAKVVKRCPFTIQLLYESTSYTQELILKVDTGSKEVGVSVVKPCTKEEVYSSEVTLRNDIKELLSTRRESRRTRRNRKTRYRAPRFNNRIKSKQKGWLAPSIEHKVDSHVSIIKNVSKLMPISKIIIEVADFDIQTIKAVENGLPVPKGLDYQKGEQMGFWNVREYVLFRDNHTCQCCKGKSKDKILNVHHIESRKTGSNAPSNLITLCEYCHNQYHNGKIKLPSSIKHKTKFNDATFMGIMKWYLYNKLCDIYGKDFIKMSFGYITKNNRINANLPKEHHIDALYIDQPDVSEYKRLNYCYYLRKVRCHNRQIHKFTILKGGLRKLNQAPYEVKGFRLFDKVKYNNIECFIFGRRSNGSFDIRLLNGTKISDCVNYKKLKLIEKRKSYLIERRPV